MNRLRLLAATLAAALLLAACGGQGSEEPEAFPSEQIRLVVPYTAGGPTDLAARTMGAHLEKALGQPVIVENMPGAAGSVQ